jgi:hypothetical protein
VAATAPGEANGRRGHRKFDLGAHGIAHTHSPLGNDIRETAATRSATLGSTRLARPATEFCSCITSG